jgi:putative transposase
LLIKAINNNGFPEKITIDGSAANKAAIEEFNSDNDTTIEVRQVKYLNNVVEQDHRGVKRITNPMLGFKSFDSASITLIGIEIVHMLRKRQLQSQDNSAKKLAEMFYSLAA